MHQYVIRVINDEGNPCSITIPVFPARQEPEFGFLQMLSAGKREHEKKRREVSQELEKMITSSAARPRRINMHFNTLIWNANKFDTYTKAVLVEEFKNRPASDSLADLIGFFTKMPTNYYTGNEALMREIATYSRYARGIHTQMLILLINELRGSYPKFAREDLSELKWGDREDFLVALDFITRIYNATTFVVWKSYEKTDWDQYSGMQDEALRKVPQLDPEILSAVIRNPQQMEHYVRKVIGWNPTVVANNAKAVVTSNAKSVAERVLATPKKLLGRD